MSTTYQPAMIPLPPTRTREGARSSRRRGGSAQPVLLGGGAGMLGNTHSSNSSSNAAASSSGGSAGMARPSASGVQPGLSKSPFLAIAAGAGSSSTRSPSPSPNMTTSPHSPIFSIPPMPPPVASRQRAAPGPAPIPTHPHAKGQSSISSLSTADSTSSRTLKTPHSKADHAHPPPIIVSGSASSSLDDHTTSTPPANVPFGLSQVKEMTEPRSPTLQMKKSAIETRRREASGAPPAMARNPLPPLPDAPQQAAKVSTPPVAAPAPIRPVKAPHRARLPPAPIKTENRLSQDWIAIPLPSPEKLPSPSLPTHGSIPPLRPMRLPPRPTMMPMKDEARSPRRPNFDRAQSEPLSENATKRTVSQPQPRKSMDQSRSISPSPMSGQGSQRQRQTSMSTPASIVMQNGGRQSMFEIESSQPPRPSLQGRRSHDLLRPSLDALRPAKKDAKALQKEQQRSLGVASTLPTQQEERKTSGLSLKKSTGALKALFARGASGKKDRSETPTPPIPALETQARPPFRPSMSDGPRPSFARSRTPSQSPSPAPQAGSSQSQTRSSFSAERTLYPAPPMQRAASASATAPSPPRRAPPPPRQLPAIPPPSPNPPPQSTSSAPEPLKQPMKLGDGLPSSSLPYLSAAARLSMAVDDTELAAQSSSVASSSPSATPPSAPAVDLSPLATSKSFHLLKMPDFGSSLDLRFDSIGFSPATPRRSPQRSPSKVSDDFFAGATYHSPSRSLSTRVAASSPRVLARTRSERRRSKSFDGIGSGSRQDLWRLLESNDVLSSPVGKLFNQSTPPQAPLQRSPLRDDDTTPGASTAKHQPKPSISSSDRTDRTDLMSSDHATPSEAGSSHATPSPSPPRTPEQRTATVLNFVDFSATSTDPVTPPRKASQLKEQRISAVLLDAPIIKAPEAPEVPDIKVEALTSDRNKSGLDEPQRVTRSLAQKSQIIAFDVNVTLRTITRDIEKLLYTFRYPSQNASSAERANLIRTELLPQMIEVEKRPIASQSQASVSATRDACFAWIDALMLELQVEQPANERGACLEGLAAMIESPCMSNESLSGNPEDTAKFTQMVIRVMNYVMGKLGAKGVFHNTLLFCGRFLAFAFFRIPHVGEQLVTVLQLPKGALMRFSREAMLDLPAVQARPNYPEFLLPLCFDSARAYTARLAALAPQFATDEEAEAFLFRPGNWLRRWQSDDSELFYAFFRAYHKQLAQYLAPAIEHYESIDQPVPCSILFRAPGYAHLATIFAKKCHSYILGSINAVTTSSTNTSFDVSEGAAFRASQKPPVLETANRRLVETLGTLAHMQLLVTTSRGIVETDGHQLWGNMVDLWTRNLITKTSLYRPQAVFSLFDLLDGIVDAPLEHDKGSILDVPYLIYLFGLILTQGDHALTLVKVIAFIFTHWEAMTQRPEDRRALCQNLLLEQGLFERLVLFWSHSVRSYLMRLVVFRLGHFHTTQVDGKSNAVEIESVALLQTRLAWLRKWHDKYENELSPSADVSIAEPPRTPVDGSFPRSRSTITMVQSPHTGSQQKAERLLGLGLGMEEDPKQRTMGGKASSWISKKFGKTKRRKDGSSPSPNLSDSPSSFTSSSPMMPSPNAGLSVTPKLGGGSTPKLDQPFRLESPANVPDSPDSDRLPSPSGRKAPPPKIMTSSPPRGAGANSPGQASYSFEFELSTASPRSDTFDPSPQPPSPSRRSSLPPSPSKTTSPRMSARLSKRASLLPSHTAAALEAILHASPAEAGKERKAELEDKGYDKKLQPYAVRMFQEFENAQKEYDEWWAEGGIGQSDGVPPRLTVAWPFHENEE